MCIWSWSCSWQLSSVLSTVSIPTQPMSHSCYFCNLCNAQTIMMHYFHTAERLVKLLSFWVLEEGPDCPQSRHSIWKVLSLDYRCLLNWSAFGGAVTHHSLGTTSAAQLLAISNLIQSLKESHSFSFYSQILAHDYKKVVGCAESAWLSSSHKSTNMTITHQQQHHRPAIEWLSDLQRAKVRMFCSKTPVLWRSQRLKYNSFLLQIEGMSGSKPKITIQVSWDAV